MNKQKSRSLTKNEELDAICWAANKVGSTYGQFSARLTDAERDEIYAEYTDYITQKAQEEKQRLEKSGYVGHKAE